MGLLKISQFCLPTLALSLVILVLSGAGSYAQSREVLLSKELLQDYIDQRHMPFYAKLDHAKNEQFCLTQAIYHEARGEPEAGQWAVGEVILNRVGSARYPGSICGVIFQNASRLHKCQFSFACDTRADTPFFSSSIERKAWHRAKLIAQSIYRNSERHIQNKKVQHNVLFYHATSVLPKWASAMKVSNRIGQHVFYRAL